MEGYLLDTNILRYWYDASSEEHSNVMARIKQLPSAAPFWISAITLGEIHYGHSCNPTPDPAGHKEYLAFVGKQVPSVAQVGRHTSEDYGRLRAALFKKYAPRPKRSKSRWIEQLIDPISGKELGAQENDLWIVANALEYGLTLVSNDKHMKRIFDVVQSFEPHFRCELDWAGRM